MTREIKFRAKSLETKKWVYGHYYAEIVFNDTSLDHFINTIPDYSNTVLVDPKTVGQFTGLKDIEGNEIYEGDVRTHNNSYGQTHQYVIEFKNGGLIGKPLNDMISLLWFVELTHTKLIGNIHDNPELLNHA